MAVEKVYGTGIWRHLKDIILIDPAGKIAKIYNNVKPVEHALQVVNDLKKIKSVKV